MELSETDFAKFVKRVEEDPLFLRLAYPSNTEEKAISRRRFSGTVVSRYFCELREDMVPDRNSFDFNSLLKNRGEIISIIRKLGMDKFKRYFLYNEMEMVPEEIAVECDLDISAVNRINDLINEISIYSEFYNPSSIITGEKIHYSKIASIESGDDGSYYIGYFPPNLVRGAYSIDYEKIWNLKKKNAFSNGELKRLDTLIKDLELINRKKSITHQVIQSIIGIQFLYMKSRDPLELVAFSQSDLAEKIEVDPSLVSRAISGRSIEMPWREEKPLKYFFPTKKQARKILIKKIIAEEKIPGSDEQIRRVLKERFNISISRRSVSSCRKELGISHSWKREKVKRAIVSHNL